MAGSGMNSKGAGAAKTGAAAPLPAAGKAAVQAAMQAVVQRMGGAAAAMLSKAAGGRSGARAARSRAKVGRHVLVSCRKTALACLLCLVKPPRATSLSALACLLCLVKASARTSRGKVGATALSAIGKQRRPLCCILSKLPAPPLGSWGKAGAMFLSEWYLASMRHLCFGQSFACGHMGQANCGSYWHGCRQYTGSARLSVFMGCSTISMLCLLCESVCLPGVV